MKITIKKSMRFMMIFEIICLIVFQQECFCSEGLSSVNVTRLNCYLIDCAKACNLTCVERVLKSGANINVQNTYGTTPIMYAINVKHGDCDRIVDLLLSDKNISLNIQNEKGNNALMRAVKKDKRTVVERLLEKGADPNLKNNDGINPLSVAMNREDHSMVLLLLRNGANPGVEQLRLFYNLQQFTRKRPEEWSSFINIFKDSRGFCGGLTKIWLYSKWASKNGISSYNSSWFSNVIKSIAEWDGDRELNEVTTEKFGNFLSLVTLFQEASYYYDMPISDVDFNGLLKSSPLYTDDKELTVEYTIAATITVRQLETLLDRIIKPNKLVSIVIFLPESFHVVALYQTDGYYQYYDPNLSKGEVRTFAIKNIAEVIIVSYGKKYFVTVGLTSFAFSKAGLLSTTRSSSSELVCSDRPYYFDDREFCDSDEIDYPLQKSILEAIEATIGEATLLTAAFICCLNSAEYCLGKNASIDAGLTKDKRTPLIVASSHGCLDVVTRFLEKKTSPNLQDVTGKTALMLAAASGFYNVTSELLKYGADPDLKDENGVTALMLSSHFGFTNIVEQLLIKGAEPNVVSTNGENALSLATRKNYPEVIEKLIDGGANPNLRFKYRVTALMIGARAGNTEAVTKLLEKGADPYLVDVYGQNALVHATIFPMRSGVIEVLKKYFR